MKVRITISFVSNGSWALENIKIKQKRLESAKLGSNSDQMLVFFIPYILHVHVRVKESLLN